MKEYEKLDVYVKGYDLGIRIHKLTQEFPNAEKFELGRQLRRAATSIPLNLAEGYGRKTLRLILPILWQWQ